MQIPFAPQLPTCYRSADGTIQDVTPGQDSGFNVRTRVHEYGGAPVAVGKEAIYFSNFKWATWDADRPCSAAGCCAEHQIDASKAIALCVSVYVE